MEGINAAPSQPKMVNHNYTESLEMEKFTITLENQKGDKSSSSYHISISCKSKMEDYSGP
jgi:hypothetical protein